MELIELLELKNAIVTTDAMSCQKKITKAIIKKEGDYILQVKDNQKKLHEEIKAYFHRKTLKRQSQHRNSILCQFFGC